MIQTLHKFGLDYCLRNRVYQPRMIIYPTIEAIMPWIIMEENEILHHNQVCEDGGVNPGCQRFVDVFGHWPALDTFHVFFTTKYSPKVFLWYTSNEAGIVYSFHFNPNTPTTPVLPTPLLFPITASPHIAIMWYYQQLYQFRAFYPEVILVCVSNYQLIDISHCKDTYP